VHFIIANFWYFMSATNYENWFTVDRVIAVIERVNFFVTQDSLANKHK